MLDKPIKASIVEGEMTFIYDDRCKELLEESGSSSTLRASHVEPGAGGDWICDLRPSGGHIVTGFRLRQEALDFERDWLEKNVLGFGMENNTEEKRMEMLWLGVTLDPGQEQDCAGVLNELLGIKSVEVDKAKMAPDGVSVVRFTIDPADISGVMVSRLKCDAKWAEDYPEYAALFREETSLLESN